MPILQQTFTEASVHPEFLVLFDIIFSFATFMYIFKCSFVRDRGNGFDHIYISSFADPLSLFELFSGIP